MTNPTQTALFAGIPSSNKIVATFTVKGEPASKARPRFDNRGSKTKVYTPAKTKAAEDRVAAEFLKVAKRKGTDPERTYGVSAHFYSGTRQRRDVDNMMKLVLDGLNGWAFPDDVQVTEIIGRKSIVPKTDARTEVTVYEIGEVDRLTKPCKECGEPFVTWPSQYDTSKFCGKECSERWRTRPKERVCQYCGKEFLAHGATHARPFCSRECRNAEGHITINCEICQKPFDQYRSWAKHHKCCSVECAEIRNKKRREMRATKKFPGTCLICGAGTTRKEYKRCNPCKLAGKKVSMPETPEVRND